MTLSSLNSMKMQAKDVPIWRVELPDAKPQQIPFFPDQNGGVYEGLLADLPAMLHCMDASGRMISVNAAWCEALGYTANDISGRAFSEFLPNESRSRLVADIYPRLLMTSSIRNAEILIQRKDGSLATMLLSITAFRGDKGRLERSVCMLEDITDRKLTQIAAVNQTDERFKMAFSVSSDGLAVVSPSGRIEIANPAMASILKRDNLESAHLSFEEILNKDDQRLFLAGMEKLLSGSIPVLQQELRYVSGEGHIVRGATSIVLVKNERGEAEHLIVQITDRSERYLLDERLNKAQKMEAIGQLTGGLAHDFNNLLTVIIGNLQLLDGKFAPEDKANRRLAEAINAAHKGSEITRQLMAIASKEELAPKDVDLNDLVKSMTPLVARSIGENFELRVESVAGVSLARVDASQFESAILNLAINARDAMAAKGSGVINIQTQAVYLDQNYADTHIDVTPGPYVLVAVTDTGVGMAPDVLEKVYQPFFTTKPPGQGNGLGLSMVYGFIKQARGHISINSEPGRGTSVQMYLPRKMEAGADSQVEPAMKPLFNRAAPLFSPGPPVVARETPKPFMAQQAVKKKILVVEDQEAVRSVVRGFLEEFGYEVLEAGDGFQALSVLQEIPDIVLMFTDVVMPGGMNGFDLAQAAQTLRPDLKIVHTSGYPKGDMAHQDEPRFKNGFIIMKPYRRDDLESMIKSALNLQ